MKVVEEVPGTVNAVEQVKESTKGRNSGFIELRECRNCGGKHEFGRREACPAFGKSCNRCKKLNHFAVKCRAWPFKSVPPKSVNAIDDDDAEEVFQTSSPDANVDDSQCVTLQLDSGNYMRFQVDTGAQCNVIPLDLYKKATGDLNLS